MVGVLENLKIYVFIQHTSSIAGLIASPNHYSAAIPALLIW